MYEHTWHVGVTMIAMCLPFPRGEGLLCWLMLPCVGPVSKTSVTKKTRIGQAATTAALFICNNHVTYILPVSALTMNTYTHLFWQLFWQLPCCQECPNRIYLWFTVLVQALCNPHITSISLLHSHSSLCRCDCRHNKGGGWGGGVCHLPSLSWAGLSRFGSRQ